MNGTDVLTLHEAAERLGVHYMTVYRWVRTGRLPATRAGAEWRVDAADVDQVRTRPPPTGAGRAARGRPLARSAAAQRLRHRLIAGDEAGAWAVLGEVMAAGASPSDVYLDTIAPAMAAIGAGWADGEVTIAEEHRATVVAGRLIGRMGPQFTRPGRKRGTIIIGLPAGEHHALPGNLLADILRGAGFDVVDVGADTPPESFVESAREASRLLAVIIGTFSDGSEDAVRAATTALHDAGPGVPVLVGGGAVADEDDARRLGGDGWTGPDARAALAAVEALTRRS